MCLLTNPLCMQHSLLLVYKYWKLMSASKRKKIWRPHTYCSRKTGNDSRFKTSKSCNVSRLKSLESGITSRLCEWKSGNAEFASIESFTTFNWLQSKRITTFVMALIQKKVAIYIINCLNAERKVGNSWVGK